MYKKIIILLLLVSLCLAQDEETARARRKGLKYKHKYHFLHHSGILYYLAFLAIKAKIVFVIGSLLSFWIFATKLFAYLKYSHHVKSEPEKIYIHSDPHPTYYPSSAEYYPPSSGFDHDHFDRNTYSSSTRDLGDDIFENENLFKDIIKRLDLTEYAFKSMDMKEEACRKRFICEADFKAKTSTVLSLGMYIFSDAGLDKYRTNSTINKFEDCAELFTDCLVMPEYVSVF